MESTAKTFIATLSPMNLTAGSSHLDLTYMKTQTPEETAGITMDHGRKYEPLNRNAIMKILRLRSGKRLGVGSTGKHPAN